MKEEGPTPMTILLLGANGQIGSSLRSRLAALDKVIEATRDDVDLSNHGLLLKKLKMYKPQIVVNAAAYTAVDKAQEEQEDAFSVNSGAVQCIAEWAKENQALLIHYSSDYVFDGKNKRTHCRRTGKVKWLGIKQLPRVGASI